MRAMILNETGSVTATSAPLTLTDIAEPELKSGGVLIRVQTCGVCHTELDEIEGRLPPARLPVVLGHQAVGIVVAAGSGVSGVAVGDRVGVAWIFSACGCCACCLAGQENLCAEFRGTGRDADGGYAEYMAASSDYVHPIPPVFSDEEAAPLLCAGAIGYRSLMLANLQPGGRLGLTGFGASAHLVLMMVRHRFPDVSVYVFARSADERAFALELGAVWAGDTADRSPALLHAIIDTTPVWKPVVEALTSLLPGGRLVINAIRKEDLDKGALVGIDYQSHLWMEKEIKTVANVTRRDVRDFLQLAAEIPIRPAVEVYELADANRALVDLKMRRVRGAKVLRIA